MNIPVSICLILAYLAGISYPVKKSKINQPNGWLDANDEQIVPLTATQGDRNLDDLNTPLLWTLLNQLPEDKDRLCQLPV